MAGDRGRGLLAVGLGVLLIAFAQRISPMTGPPLYDGLPQVDPYVWLVPPAGARGGAQGAEGSAAVDHGTSRVAVVATPENPPQAQLFAAPGALILPAGTTSIKLSIKPIVPVELPTVGHILGNVYRVSVTNQAGTALTAPVSAEVTVVMRSPHLGPNQTIEVDVGGGWQPLKTQDEGFAASYLAVVTHFGDFAMVAPGAASPAASAAGSAAPSATDAVPSIGVVGGSPDPSSAPGPVDALSGGGLPVVPIIVVIGLVMIGTIVVLWSRSRRRPPGPPSYRAAHRR